MTNLGVLFEEARKKYGFNHQDREKISRYPTDHKKSKTSTTGLYHVKKRRDYIYRQGFCYIYFYYDEDGERRSLSSIDILKLKQKVLDAGQKWEVYDKQKVLDLANYHNIDVNLLL